VESFDRVVVTFICVALTCVWNVIFENVCGFSCAGGLMTQGVDDDDAFLFV